MAIKSPLQQLIVDYLKGKGISQRKFADTTGTSESAFGVYARMSSAMGIDVLDKILTKYPDIKPVLIEYLGGYTDKDDKNLQPQQKIDETAVRAELRKMREELRLMKKLATTQGEALLHFTRVDAVEEG
jgi:hypothetical protein